MGHFPFYLRASVSLFQLNFILTLQQSNPFATDPFGSVVNSASWGLKWRVFIGASLSTVDLMSDVYITYTFWKDDEKETFFKYSVAMIGTSVFLMLFVVWAQNRKMGWKRLLREMVPVVVGLKPAVDAFRVASGAKIEEGQAFDPLAEMTYVRATEMFAESIPGVLIQLLAIMTDGHASAVALTSLAISALTTGFISATISYDWDTDPRNRLVCPKFYGYIPDSASKRAIVFVSLFFLSANMLLVRAAVLTLLGLTSQSAAAFYIIADMAMYLLFKAVRGDFFYWLQCEGLLEFGLSFLERVMAKATNDYTSNAHFRHPNEIGGFCCMVSYFLNLASLPLAVLYYENYASDNENVTSLAWKACFLIPSALFLMTMFLAHVKKEYRKTFWSMKLSWQMTQEYLESDDESIKTLIFWYNVRHWKGVEDKLEDLVRENWKRWMEEEPEWFDDNMRNMIPPKMIPNEGGKVKQAKRGARRPSLIPTQSGRRGSRRSSQSKVAPVKS